jgi:hypothetical protein
MTASEGLTERKPLTQEILMIVTVEGETIHLIQRLYPNGRFAIEGVYNEYESYGPLTVNIVNESLGQDEFFIKTWGGNEEFADVAMATGIFIDTGRIVKTGFVVAPVWKLKPGVSLPTVYGSDF